ncbi:MAG: response regulator [Acetatifactor sp.]|nr:response regulator [Acetatifactor sp.]
MKNKTFLRERNLTATFIMILIMVILFVSAYLWCSQLIEKRSFLRMEEGVDTVIDEITQKLTRDSRILNTTANILASSDNFNLDTMREVMTAVSPMLETMYMEILLPDNSVIAWDGSTLPNNGEISFEKEMPLGEHVSNRMVSILDGDTYVLRYFVPIIKNGETVAMLFGVTDLKNLPSVLNIDHIYNAKADAYIIDTETGDYIMDTWRDHLGNVKDRSGIQTRDGAIWDEKVQEVLDLKRGHVEYRSEATGKWVHLYYAPANINQWAIAVSVPEEEAFANVFAIRWVFFVIGCLAGIVVIIYYMWMRKNAIDAINKAVETAVLEEKLHKAEAAERAKTMFLSNMSHDIRTPMNAIIGFTTLAQTNIENKERVQGYLAKIMSSSNHLLSLINDILDMSRIESGRLNIEEKECSISDIFRDMRNILQTQMQSKQLNFFMDTLDVVDEDIYCDKLHLNQVLLNLLSNAIKFTPSGGSVSMTIKQNPGAPIGYGAYEIRVKDTGIGMSAEFAKHVFEPFEREKTSTVSGIQGTGLGMAITKSIIDAMGGTIEVETQQGRGTEYIIHLEFRLQTEPKKIEVIRELEGLRALVVDDNFNTCDSVTKMLTQIGMRVEWTLRGKEAVLYAKQAVEMHDEFHAYIIDWALPDLGGIEVARQIRSLVGENVPIIILTAYDWTLIEDEARNAGVTAFCNKPIFISELRDALSSAIGKTGKVSTESILPATSVELKGRRLLLVEDNELNREIAQEILEESDFVVETAEDGTIAVEKVKNAPHGYYDLILMDVQMPIMNGYEATRAIRALEDKELASIPIVAMTANAFDEDRQNAMNSGMNAHVAKPINVQNLMEVLQALLR